MGSLGRPWHMIESELIVLVGWFHRACVVGETQSLVRCAKETGVPRTTIQYYIEAYKNFGEDRWFFRKVAEKYFYKIHYIGEPGNYLFVQKYNPFMEPCQHYLDNEDFSGEVSNDDPSLDQEEERA